MKYKIQDLVLEIDTKTVREVLQRLRESRNKDKNRAIALFNFLRFKTGYSNKNELSLKRIQMECFPKEFITEPQLRSLMSRLYHTVKEVMISREAIQNEDIHDILYLRALLNSGATDLASEYAQKSMASDINTSNENYRFKNHLLEINYELLGTTSRDLSVPLRQSQDSLHIATLVSYLKTYCQYLSLSKINHLDWKPDIVNSIVDMLSKHVDTTDILLKRWFWSLEIIKNDCEASFRQLSDNINYSCNNRIAYSDIQAHYFFCINFAIRKANTGQKSYVVHAFDLYKLGLEHKLLFRGKYLSRFTYRNIINHGMALEQSDWVQNFMETYKTSLSPKFREQAYTFNLARFHFRRSEYDLAMTHLRDAEFNDISYNLDARRMTLRIYCAKEEWHSLGYFLDSFSSYILRKKQQHKATKNYAPLVKFTRSFLNNLNKSSRLQHLEQKVRNHPIFVDQKWLIELIQQKQK